MNDNSNEKIMEIKQNITNIKLIFVILNIDP